jgi:hypothetical protein
MENASRTCFFCSKAIVSGTRAAFVTIKDESSDRVYHLSCFEACTTGSRRDGEVWAYRIVDMPTKDER